MKTEIKTNNAPAAIGPYSQGIMVDGLLFVSGQIPIDPATGYVVDDNADIQTKQVMENIMAVLKEAQMDMSNIIKATIYLADMDDFSDVNKVYQSYLSEPYPARATIEVSRLPKGVDVEIEVIAKK